MELPDLTEEETIVFIGLLRSVLRADGQYTKPEQGFVAELSEAFGSARFRASMDEAAERYGDLDTLKDAAKALERAEARQLIFDTLIRAAAVDGVDEAEVKPLSWLGSWWGLKPSD